MEQGVFRHCRGTAAAAVIAMMWVSAAVAAPVGQGRCDLARAWVQEHCGGAARMAASREGTPRRCAKARGWIQERCSAKASAPGRHAYRHKPWDNAAGYAAPRPARLARRSHTTVVYYSTERPRRCCRWVAEAPYWASRVRGVVYYQPPIAYGYRPPSHYHSADPNAYRAGTLDWWRHSALPGP
jgi:hypothetical protein